MTKNEQDKCLDHQKVSGFVDIASEACSYKENSLLNGRGEMLGAHYWSVKGKPLALVFLSHGFSEHLGLYHQVAKFLNEYGFFVFGHDHVGHGKSEGKRVYIENVDHYCDDIITHCQIVQEVYPNLKLFLVGHSMGGMVAIRTVLMNKNFFDGMVLNGPLIIPGPQIFGMDLRPTPVKTFVFRVILGLLSLAIPESVLGNSDLNKITKDEDMKDMLTKDKLRWTSGCKVRLLLAFVDCLDENMNQLDDIRIPFLVLQGSEDSLCNPTGASLLYRRSRSDDKEVKIFHGSRHQLFFDLPQQRQEAFSDIATWIKTRC